MVTNLYVHILQSLKTTFLDLQLEQRRTTLVPYFERFLIPYEAK
jgi:hypothetical protein